MTTLLGVTLALLGVVRCKHRMATPDENALAEWPPQQNTRAYMSSELPRPDACVFVDFRLRLHDEFVGFRLWRHDLFVEFFLISDKYASRFE
jgi:hypothetical protein